jgi:hypothetical protein
MLDTHVVRSPRGHRAPTPHQGFGARLLRRERLGAFAGVVGLALASAVACGVPVAEPPAPPATSDAPYAVHVYVGPERTRYDFGPASDLGGPEAAREGVSSTRPLSVNPLAGDAVPAVQDPTVDQPRNDPWSTAWALVWGASLECDPLQAATIPPWDDLVVHGGTHLQRWFLFDPSAPDSAAALLKREDHLLCIADKLAEVSDAAGTIVWRHENVPGHSGEGARVAYGTTSLSAAGAPLAAAWTIPPQADQDRFIVRDLAIHVLAQIPFLDATRVQRGGPFGLTAAEALASVAQNGVSGDENDESLLLAFGVRRKDKGSDGHWQPTFPLYPPSQIPLVSQTYDATGAPLGPMRPEDDHSMAIARNALTVEAQILRSAGRLLRDLIRRSVYADLAGAEQRGARVMDPARANRIAWGAEGPYNSLAHAARVLGGRWEIGPNQPDPQCGGVRALDLLDAAYGGDRTARVEDAPIQTAGQATASQMLEQAGIVIPRCALANLSDAGALRAAIAAEVTAQIASVNQVALDAASPDAKAVRTAIDTLSDADLRFGLARTYRTYRMLTNLDDPRPAAGATETCASLAASVAGVSRRAVESPAITALGGAVIAGGIGRSRLATDVMSHAAALLEASACNEKTDAWSPWGTTTQSDLRGPPEPIDATGAVRYAWRLPRGVFQGAFQIGQAIERRLTSVRAWSDSPAIVGDRAGDPESVARSGMAELRSWAGSAMFVATAPATTSDAPSALTVSVAGYDYADFGTSASASAAIRAEAVRDALLFVYGPPWVAECAAKLRTDCPANFEASYVVTASAVSESADASDLALTDGALAPRFDMTLTLPQGTTAPQFRPKLRGASVGDEHLYVVRKRDPEAPGDRGAILGSIALRRQANEALATSFVVSPMQRELFGVILGLGTWVGERPRIGDASASKSGGYCIDGVSRDMFVPLENELTSDSDAYESSWRHYLKLAKEAATRADALGKELIALELEQDERREAAGEALGGICGDMGAIGDVRPDERGKIVPRASDATLAACLGEEKVDVVFLASIPTELAKIAADHPNDLPAIFTAATPWIKANVLLCGDRGKSNELCKKAVLSFDALNLTDRPARKTLADCAEIQTAATTLRTGLNAGALNRALAGPLASDDALKFVAQNLHIDVDLSARWSVTYLDVAIMDTESDRLWPGCLRSPWTCLPSAKTMNALYRSCPEKDVDTTPLGGCDAAPTTKSVWAELNALRWRVEGSLRFLGSVTGGAPQAMFRTPIPVYDETVRPSPVPVGAAYHGKLEAVPAGQGGPGYRINGSPSAYTAADEYLPTAAEIQALGMTYDVPEQWGHYDVGALLTEIPPWLYRIYRNDGANRARVRHRPAANVSETAGYYETYYGPDAPKHKDGEAFPLAFFGNFLTPMEGMRCDRLAGRASDRDPIVWNEHPLTDLVGAIKMNQREPIFYDPRDSTGRPMGKLLDFLIVSGYAPAWDPQRGTNKTHYGFFSPTGYDGHLWQAPSFQMGGKGETETDETLYRFAPATFRYPEERVLGFVNAGVPNGDCAAAATLFQTMGLACLGRATQREQLASLEPPKVQSVNGIASLEAWLGVAAEAFKIQLGDLYVEKLPRRVLEDFHAHHIGSGSTKGEHGEQILKLEEALQALPRQWNRVSTDLAHVGYALQDVRLAMAGADLAHDVTLRNIALAHVRLDAEEAQAAWHFVSSASSSLASVVATGGAAAPYAFASMYGAYGGMATTLDTTWNARTGLFEQGLDADKLKALQLSGALSKMSQATTTAWADAHLAYGEIRSSIGTILTTAEAIDHLEDKAQYEAAKGSGADYAVLGEKAVPIRVNTVLRRQARATEIRYRRALDSAKTLAYMARRAIEQRIGTPLSAITTRVGSLEAPASWADDVCRRSGIDYASLRTALPPGADEATRSAIEEAAVRAFADAFIGDYVADLESFVAQYNVQFPSHDGDDVTVLSLKDDLLGQSATCLSESANLLYDSGRLDSIQSAGDSGTRGWAFRSWDAASAKQLFVVGGVALAPPRLAPSAGVGIGAGAPLDDGHGVTWLNDVRGASSGAGSSSSIVRGVVTQTLRLEPGKYVLSWWDQARSETGGFPTPASASVPYRAEVYDATWRLVSSFRDAPYGSSGSAAVIGGWSGRRQLTFVVPSPADYHVAFGASAPGDPRNGSVALAGVQLEKAQASGGPSTYVETTGTRLVPGGACRRSPAAFRALFERRCEGATGCFYELPSSFTIDTQALRDGVSALDGKLARGNFNFRHIAVALNLVGTNVRDCTETPTSACFGTGYTEYTLEHDARSAGIVDYSGDVRAFDFGLARVEHGKAITAERYITLPPGSNDQALLAQPGIEKQELSGRPLDGNYRLRIWESPGLKWSRLDDVQIVLRYRYWSRIDKDARGN